VKDSVEQRDGEHRRPAGPVPRAGKGSAGSESGAGVGIRFVSQLQRAAGNRAVSALVAQRRATGPGGRAGSGKAASAPPSGPSPAVAAAPAEVQRLDAGGRTGPETDPKFRALEGDIRAKQKVLTAHPPAVGSWRTSTRTSGSSAWSRCTSMRPTSTESSSSATPRTGQLSRRTKSSPNGSLGLVMSIDSLA